MYREYQFQSSPLLRISTGTKPEMEIQELMKGFQSRHLLFDDFSLSSAKINIMFKPLLLSSRTRDFLALCDRSSAYFFSIRYCGSGQTCSIPPIAEPFTITLSFESFPKTSSSSSSFQHPEKQLPLQHHELSANCVQ